MGGQNQPWLSPRTQQMKRCGYWTRQQQPQHRVGSDDIRGTHLIADTRGVFASNELTHGLHHRLPTRITTSTAAAVAMRTGTRSESHRAVGTQRRIKRRSANRAPLGILGSVLVLVLGLLCIIPGPLPTLGSARPAKDPIAVDNLDSMAPVAFKEYTALADTAKTTAAAKLEQFHLPSVDGKTLHINKDGTVFVAETFPAAPRDRRSVGTHGGQVSAMDANSNTGDGDGGGLRRRSRARRFLSHFPTQNTKPCEAPLLHSRPSSSNRIVLDFDGHTARAIDTTWGEFRAKPYDPSNDGACFSSKEQDLIKHIWARVAEDYAPFDIDVTTELVDQTPTTLYVVVTSSTQKTGRPMPYSESGGVAVIGAYGSSSISYYSPSLVFWDNLGVGSPSRVADAISHEAGHNFGLGHDGVDAKEYFEGFDGTSSENSWGPIMGAPYDRDLTQWSDGEYPGATNTQDDVAIIGKQTGFAPDEAGTGADTAASVTYDGGISFHTEGVIASRSDVDWWAVEVTESGASLSADATPWYANRGSAGNNLDISIRLYASDGQTVLARSSPSGTSSASLSRSLLAAGRYFLAVDGVADSPVYLSDYGSIGQYRIEGTVSSGAPSSTIAPPALPSAPSVAPRIGTACGPDRFEDNDVHSQAFDLSALMASDEPGGIRGSICPRDLDWYRVPVGAHGTVTVMMYLDSSEGDLDLVLFTPSGEHADESTSVTNLEGVQYTDATGNGGLCYLLVRGVSDASGNYSLHIFDSSMDGFCAYDPFETNNEALSAFELQPGQNAFNAWLCPEDEDWYRIPVCAGSPLVVDVQFSAQEGDIDVVLYSPSGEPVDQGSTDTSDERVEHENTGGDGLYLMRVFEFNGKSIAYTVHILRDCDYPSTTSTLVPLHTTASPASSASTVTANMTVVLLTLVLVCTFALLRL